MWRDWEEVSFDTNLDLLCGYAFSSEFFNDDYEGVPLVRIRDILAEKLETYYSGSYPSEYLIQNGDILIGMDGDFNITTWSKGNALLNQRVLKVSEKKHSQISDRFIYHWLDDELPKINAAISGTTVKHLSTKDLLKLCPLLPEKDEQKAIAEVLDTVDEAIAATQAMLDKQDKIKDGLLQDLLTRGVDANGKLRNEKQSLNGKLSHVVNLVNHKIAIGKNPDLPYIGLEHLDKRTLHISRHGNALDSVSTNNVFSPNDILFGKLRPNLKKCALAETHGYCSTDILVLRANTNINPLFALYICSSEPIFYEAIKSTEGTKMPRTSWAAIKDVPVYLPDTEEQNLIVAVMDSHLKKKRDTENELNKLKKLKAGLMQDLLTGKKRISKNQREAA